MSLRAAHVLVYFVFASFASAEIFSMVKSTNKDPLPQTAVSDRQGGSTRRSTKENTQYAVNGLASSSDSWELAVMDSGGTYTPVLGSSPYLYASGGSIGDDPIYYAEYTDSMCATAPSIVYSFSADQCSCRSTDAVCNQYVKMVRVGSSLYYEDHGSNSTCTAAQSSITKTTYSEDVCSASVKLSSTATTSNSTFNTYVCTSSSCQLQTCQDSSGACIGSAGPGFKMTVETDKTAATAAQIKLSSGSGSVGPCFLSPSKYQSNSFVGTTFYTGTKGALDQRCSGLKFITYGNSFTTIGNLNTAAMTLQYALVVPSTTSTIGLATYLKTSSGVVMSLGSGQVAGDAVASKETSDCGSSHIYSAITVASSFAMESPANWDSGAGQSLYGIFNFTMTCGTIPMLSIVGYEDSNYMMVCSGCESAFVYPNRYSRSDGLAWWAVLLIGVAVVICLAIVACFIKFSGLCCECVTSCGKQVGDGTAEAPNATKVEIHSNDSL